MEKYVTDKSSAIPHLIKSPPEWPHHGIKVINGGDVRSVHELYNCFKTIKKEIESASPPSSPVDGPQCHGVLLDECLSPGENESGTLLYVEDIEWLKKNRLGEGSSGVVSEAYDLTTDSDVAVKEIPFIKYEPYEGYVWSHLDHPNIPKLYGIVREVQPVAGGDQGSGPGTIFLFCEKITNDHLFVDYVEEHCQDMPSFLLKEFLDSVTQQVKSAVDHIHSKGFTHNDLLGFGNVVIEEWQNEPERKTDRKAWVLDFGRATKATPSGKMRDKYSINYIIGKVYEVLAKREEEEKDAKRRKEEENKEMVAEIAASMKGLALQEESGTGTLPKAAPPASNWKLDTDEEDRTSERIGNSRFFRVITSPTGDVSTNASSVSSTSTINDLLASQAQSEDQSTLSVENLPTQIQVDDPSNENPSTEVQENTMSAGSESSVASDLNLGIQPAILEED